MSANTSTCACACACVLSHKYQPLLFLNYDKVMKYYLSIVENNKRSENDDTTKCYTETGEDNDDAMACYLLATANGRSCSCTRSCSCSR